MRKQTVRVFAAGIMVSLSILMGCGTSQEADSVPTEQPTITVTATATPTVEPTATPEPTAEPTATPTVEPTATPEPMAEPTATPTVAPTATPIPTPTSTPIPTATPTPTPIPTPTVTPVPTKTPIVQAVGDVDASAYQKVESAFENIVNTMRTDGLISSDAVCIIMDANSIKVDITFDSEEIDILLCKENDNVYTLILDYDFIWLEGFSTAINGIDPAPYNRELLLALLGVVSSEPQTLFDTIDLTYFSSYSLSGTEWTQVGDCYMLDGDMVVDDFISYHITKDAQEQVPQPTEAPVSTETAYEEFPYPLYKATYADGWFTFYHEGSHPGYSLGVKSIGELLPSVAESMMGQYPGGTRYGIDEYAAIVTKMGQYKNVSLYYENSEYMNVVKIDLPLVITPPEPVEYEACPYPVNTIIDENLNIYFYYDLDAKEPVFDTLKEQVEQLASDRASALASENVGKIVRRSSYSDYIGRYKEGRIQIFGYEICFVEEE